MIFAQGKLLPDTERKTVLDGLEAQLNAVRAGPPLEAETVISAVDALGRRLEGGEFDDLLARFLPAGVGLGELLPLLRRESLEAKLAAELGPDPFAPREYAKTTAQVLPLGVLFHIAPGNMPGLPVYTALEGLLTGNVNLVKLPHGDKGLSLAAFQLLTEQEPRLAPYLYAFDLPSGRREELKTLSGLADGLVVWGGDGAIASARTLAGPGCKLIEWGHRLSFAYLSGWAGLDLSGLAEHIVRTGGLLCSSCQVIYLDTELLSAAEQFCKQFLPILERAAAEYYKTPGQAAQGALYAREAALEQMIDRAGSGDLNFPGRCCSLTLRRDMELELSRLHGNVLVKRLPRKGALSVLRRQRGRLQTAGLLCPPSEREELAGLLARAGVNRVTDPDRMSETLPGEAHDGEYPLRRYVRAVDLQINF